jgi:hypothetical protein
MIPDFFSSFFSSYILLSITTLVILLGSIYLYINHRMSDQDHKLASVVNVIQGIIYDTQVIKSQLIGPTQGQDQASDEAVVVELDQDQDNNEAKIVVSDCEYSDSESNMSSDSDSTVTAAYEPELVASTILDINETDADSDANAEVVLDIDESAVADDDLMEEVKGNDFKKMPVGALRELIQEKGLHEDPSKLKKPDLLELLA